LTARAYLVGIDGNGKDALLGRDAAYEVHVFQVEPPVFEGILHQRQFLDDEAAEMGPVVPVAAGPVEPRGDGRRPRA
jgi:hypothetical protein